LFKSHSHKVDGTLVHEMSSVRKVLNITYDQRHATAWVQISCWLILTMCLAYVIPVNSSDGDIVYGTAVVLVFLSCKLFFCLSYQRQSSDRYAMVGG